MKLHLGCGKRDFGKDWVHIDRERFPHIRSHDIQRLPFEDESADLIYASHVLEYFDREEVVDALNEWKRVLKTGGILRIAVPDFGALANLYTNGEVNLDQVLGPLYGKMGDPPIYHKTVYDFNSIDMLLSGVGFKNCQWYDWRQTEHSHFDDHSQAYIPHMDKDNGVLISLNVECVK
jgi:predicted SAM-dependent methyltransferase